MYPTKKSVDNRRRTVVVTISVAHDLHPGDELYDVLLECIEKLGFSGVTADSSMEGYYLCSDS